MLQWSKLFKQCVKQSKSYQFVDSEDPMVSFVIQKCITIMQCKNHLSTITFMLLFRNNSSIANLKRMCFFSDICVLLCHAVQLYMWKKYSITQNDLLSGWKYCSQAKSWNIQNTCNSCRCKQHFSYARIKWHKINIQQNIWTYTSLYFSDYRGLHI